MRSPIAVAIFLFMIGLVAEAEVYEIAQWKFKPEIAFNDAKSAVDGLGTFLKSAPGFKNRTTYFDSKKKQWCDLVVWENEASALAAAQNIELHPAYKNFAKIADENSINLGHYERVATR